MEKHKVIAICCCMSMINGCSGTVSTTTKGILDFVFKTSDEEKNLEAASIADKKCQELGHEPGTDVYKDCHAEILKQ